LSSGDFADLHFRHCLRAFAICALVEPARAVTQRIPTDGVTLLLIAPPPVATLHGALQWRGYTQDTDENGGYLQNQIRPMQIEQCSPPLDA
jgi:hypothetical protein